MLCDGGFLVKHRGRTLSSGKHHLKHNFDFWFCDKVVIDNKIFPRICLRTCYLNGLISKMMRRMYCCRCCEAEMDVVVSVLDHPPAFHYVYHCEYRVQVKKKQ